MLAIRCHLCQYFTLKFALLFNNTIWHSRHSCSTASTLSTTESVDLDNFAYLLCNPASQEGEGPCLPPAQPWWSPWLWEMRWTWLWTRSWPGMRRFSIFTIPFISREILDLIFHCFKGIFNLIKVFIMGEEWPSMTGPTRSPGVCGRNGGTRGW